jgi:predicted RecB family nuclease
MPKITRDILKAYLACRHKARLKLANQQASTFQETNSADGDNSVIPVTLTERELPLVSKNHPNDLTELTPKLLSAGPPNVIGGLYETDFISIRIDAVQRASGASELGAFHYKPVVVHTAGQVHESHRLLLEVYGVILSWLQGRAPEAGIVWRAKGKSSTVPVSRGLKKASTFSMT